MIALGKYIYMINCEENHFDDSKIVICKEKKRAFSKIREGKCHCIWVILKFIVNFYSYLKASKQLGYLPLDRVFLICVSYIWKMSIKI